MQNPHCLLASFSPEATSITLIHTGLNANKGVVVVEDTHWLKPDGPLGLVLEWPLVALAKPVQTATSGWQSWATPRAGRSRVKKE